MVSDMWDVSCFQFRLCGEFHTFLRWILGSCSFLFQAFQAALHKAEILELQEVIMHILLGGVNGSS